MGVARADTTATDGFGGGVLDVESATVERVVADVEQSAGALLGKVEVDEGPAVSGEKGEIRRRGEARERG